MGPGFAASLAEDDAAGSEWRTAPLWNIGLTVAVSDGDAYLHDGRVRSLHQAILRPGGGVEASMRAYTSRSEAE